MSADDEQLATRNVQRRHEYAWLRRISGGDGFEAQLLESKNEFTGRGGGRKWLCMQACAANQKDKYQEEDRR